MKIVKSWNELITEMFHRIINLANTRSVEKVEKASVETKNLMTYFKECLFLDVKDVKDGIIVIGNDLDAQYKATKIWEFKKRKKLKFELAELSGMLKAFDRMPTIILECKPRLIP